MTEAGPGPWVTKSGKVLTNEDIEALADEAERGYDVRLIICRAARWKGTPVFEGEHAFHFFTYGPHGEYTGSCAGWPKPNRKREHSDG